MSLEMINVWNVSIALNTDCGPEQKAIPERLKWIRSAAKAKRDDHLTPAGQYDKIIQEVASITENRV